MTSCFPNAKRVRNLPAIGGERNCEFDLAVSLTRHRAIVRVGAFMTAPTGNWGNLRLSASVYADKLKARKRLRRNVC